MDVLPPQTSHKLVRVRYFRLRPDGILTLIRELVRERLTGKLTVNLSQGGIGPVVVEDSQEISPEGT